MKSIHYSEVTMKTQLQTGYIRLTALVVVAASLVSVLGGVWRP